MATIKLTTSGSVILKDGSPSCTCCNCVPDVNTVYIEVIDNSGSPAVAIYYEMTGTLNPGAFSFGDDFLTWNATTLVWDYTSQSYGNQNAVSSLICDPSSTFTIGGFDITISLTPLP